MNAANVRQREPVLDQGLGPKQLVVELLDAIDDAGVHARCVASNGPQNKMQASLASAGLIDRFDHAGEARINSAYDIGVWKPEPDLFLHAAEQMGHAPSDSVVIEDSASGVVAAGRAGMRVIGLSGLTPPDVLADAGATHVVSSLHELVRALEG